MCIKMGVVNRVVRVRMSKNGVSESDSNSVSNTKYFLSENIIPEKKCNYYFYNGLKYKQLNYIWGKIM